MILLPLNRSKVRIKAEAKEKGKHVCPEPFCCVLFTVRQVRDACDGRSHEVNFCHLGLTQKETRSRY